MNVAYYARTSVDLHTDSIENQFAIMERCIRSKPDLQGAQILYFADKGQSGIDTEREAFQELLAQVRQRRIDCIIIKDFSRLGRNYLDVCKLTESILPFMGVRLISVNENYDSVKAANAVELSTAFKSVLNEYYVIETSEKLKHSCRMRIKSGDFIGHVPYGYYRIDKQHIGIHEEQAAVVREIFSQFVSGCSTLDIAAELNRKRIPTCEGKKWTAAKVRLILKNESYTGKRVSLKETRDIKTKQKIQNPESSWFVDEHGYPAIISGDIYSTVQQMLPVGVRRNVRDQHLMARKLFCAGCGRTLYRNYYDFGCKLPLTTGENACFVGSLKMDILYPAVLDKVKTIIKSELDNYKKQFSFSEIVKLEAEITRLKEEKAALFEQMLTEQIRQEECQIRKRSITKQIADKQQIADEKRRCYALTAKLDSAERPIQTLKRLYEADELNHEHMKFVKRITVSDPDHFEIELMDGSSLEILCRNVGIYEEE